MPLRLIVCPTIHVVVEDADTLTAEVQERITAWLNLPEYQPHGIEGVTIRAEHIHGGSAFKPVPETDMESVEASPINYEIDADPFDTPDGVRIDAMEII